MRADWRESSYGEWWAEDLGVVFDLQGLLWFGYRERDNRRVGPFRSLLEAQRALEEETTDDEGDDEITLRRARP